MSHELTPAAYRTRLGNSTAKSVLVLLCDQANVEGLGWPSIGYIAKGTEVNRRTVLRIVEVFAAMNLVAAAEVVPRAGARKLAAFQIDLEMLGTDLAAEFAAAYARAQGKLAVKTGPGKWCLRDAAKSVSETRQCVSETRQRVSETQPPHPLIGGTVMEPVLTLLPPTPSPGEGARAAESDPAADSLTPGQLEELERFRDKPEMARGLRAMFGEENRAAASAAMAERAEAARLALLAEEMPTLAAARGWVMRGCGFVDGMKGTIGGVVEAVLAECLATGESLERTAPAMVDAWKLQQRQGLRLRARYGPKNFFLGGAWRNVDGWHWNVDFVERERGASVGSRR